MATMSDHMKDTLARLGKEFEEVHRYMDQWHGKFGGKHRFMLHHEEGVEEVRRMFGDEAAEAAQCHIRLDCLGRVPKKADYTNGKVDFLGHGEDAYRVIDKRSGIVIPNYKNQP